MLPRKNAEPLKPPSGGSSGVDNNVSRTMLTLNILHHPCNITCSLWWSIDSSPTITLLWKQYPGRGHINCTFSQPSLLFMRRALELSCCPTLKWRRLRLQRRWVFSLVLKPCCGTYEVLIAQSGRFHSTYRELAEAQCRRLPITISDRTWREDSRLECFIWRKWRIY